MRAGSSSEANGEGGIRARPALWHAAVVAGANVIALAELPYGYYQLLRILVTAYAVWVAWQAAANDRKAIAYLFGAIAVLYNPILKIHMERDVHAIFNVITAALVLGEAWLARRKAKV